MLVHIANKKEGENKELTLNIFYITIHFNSISYLDYYVQFYEMLSNEKEARAYMMTLAYDIIMSSIFTILVGRYVSFFYLVLLSEIVDRRYTCAF